MIYTGYFAGLRGVPEHIVPVSIALYKPKFYNGREYKTLAPTPYLLSQYKKDNDFEYYTECYTKDILSRLDIRVVLQDLYRITQTYDMILLCYEKPSDNCHRHLVRKWMQERGVKCEEFKA